MIDLSKYLDARAFLVGLAVSFASLSAAGWLVSSRNMFSDYQRSHQFISVETQFIPSARQLGALVEDTLSPDRIAVIIGGSSVFRGNGQSATALWSGYLQRSLGSQYQVLNLALNGGSPGGQALYFSEMLKAAGRKVIFVSDVSLNATIFPDNGPVYRSLYMDAHERGYFPDFPERNQAVERSFKSSDRMSLVDFKIKSLANKYLNFDDLWTYVAYNGFFTIWTPLLRNDPFSPRSGFVDSEADCPGGSGYTYNVDLDMAILRSLTDPQLSIEHVEETVDYTFSPDIRPNTALVATPNSPFYVDQLTETEHQTYLANFQDLATRLSATGIEPIMVPEIFEDADYCDRVHYAPSGGEKLATFLAPLIVAKARELGYE